MERPRILVLCTANQCRSPMAEGLLRELLRRHGVDALIESGGLLEGGVPATASAVEVLGDRGIDLSGHRSRSLAELSLGTADLVLTMERRHLQEAVIAEPSIRARTYTLIDAVRRAERGDSRPPGTSFRQWAESLSAGRTSAEILGRGDDEIADPIGQSRARYEETATLLEDLLARLVGRAWPASVLA